jgi:hypothetical protein
MGALRVVDRGHRRVRALLALAVVLPTFAQARFSFYFDVVKVGAGAGGVCGSILSFAPLGSRGGFATSVFEQVADDARSFFPVYQYIVLTTTDHPWSRPKMFESRERTRLPILTAYLYAGAGLLGESYVNYGLALQANPLYAIPVEVRLGGLSASEHRFNISVSAALGTWISIGK